MTDSELRSLYDRRQAALEATSGGGGRNRAFRDLGEAGQARATAASREFREADAAIVAELRRRDSPAVLGAMTLHLTGDGLNFVTLSTATGRLLFGCVGSRATGAGILYRYPEKSPSPRRGRPGRAEGRPGTTR